MGTGTRKYKYLMEWELKFDEEGGGKGYYNYPFWQIFDSDLDCKAYWDEIKDEAWFGASEGSG